MGNLIVKPYSHKKVSWMCDQCPNGHLHSWLAPVNNRTIGSGCPQCSGRQVCQHNSLPTKAPLIAAQWDYASNTGTPDDVVAHSHMKFGWQCPECGCKWRAAPDSRVSKGKTGCPRCAKDANKDKKKTTHPTFAECKHRLLAEWDDRHKAEKPQADLLALHEVPSRARAQLVCKAL